MQSLDEEITTSEQDEEMITTLGPNRSPWHSRYSSEPNSVKRHIQLKFDEIARNNKCSKCKFARARINVRSPMSLNEQHMGKVSVNKTSGSVMQCQKRPDIDSIAVKTVSVLARKHANPNILRGNKRIINIGKETPNLRVTAEANASQFLRNALESSVQNIMNQNTPEVTNKPAVDYETATQSFTIQQYVSSDEGVASNEQVVTEGSVGSLQYALQNRIENTITQTMPMPGNETIASQSFESHRQELIVSLKPLVGQRSSAGYCEYCNEDFDTLDSHLKSKHDIDFDEAIGGDSSPTKTVNNDPSYLSELYTPDVVEQHDNTITYRVCEETANIVKTIQDDDLIQQFGIQLLGMSSHPQDKVLTVAHRMIELVRLVRAAHGIDPSVGCLAELLHCDSWPLISVAISYVAGLQEGKTFRNPTYVTAIGQAMKFAAFILKKNAASSRDDPSVVLLAEFIASVDGKIQEMLSSGQSEKVHDNVVDITQSGSTENATYNTPSSIATKPKYEFGSCGTEVIVPDILLTSSVKVKQEGNDDNEVTVVDSEATIVADEVTIDDNEVKGESIDDPLDESGATVLDDEVTVEDSRVKGESIDDPLDESEDSIVENEVTIEDNKVKEEKIDDDDDVEEDIPELGSPSEDSPGTSSSLHKHSYISVPPAADSVAETMRVHYVKSETEVSPNSEAKIKLIRIMSANFKLNGREGSKKKSPLAIPSQPISRNVHDSVVKGMSLRLPKLNPVRQFKVLKTSSSK